jgi:hypothetical protein
MAGSDRSNRTTRRRGRSFRRLLLRGRSRCSVDIAAWVSDSLNDVRAWTLVAAVATGYMISRGLAKSGSKYAGGEDPLNRNDR